MLRGQVIKANTHHAPISAQSSTLGCQLIAIARPAVLMVLTQLGSVILWSAAVKHLLCSVVSQGLEHHHMIPGKVQELHIDVETVVGQLLPPCP